MSIWRRRSREPRAVGYPAAPRLRRRVLATGLWILRKEDGLKSDLTTALTATTTACPRFVAKVSAETPEL